MKSIEATGKSLNQAIENGLKELGKTEDEVNVTVLTMGGLFSKYKVLLTVIDPEEKKIEQQKDVVQPKAKVVAPQSEEKTEKVVEAEQETQTVKEKAIVVDTNAPDILDEFLRGMLQQMQVDARFIISADEERINVSIRSANDGAKLIGRRGETLKSIQQICYAVLALKSHDTRRICVDIENYRNRRDEVLVNLAIRTAHKVAKTKKKIALEPMNSYERRVIHNALQNDKFCTTYSEGKEPHRHLVIDLK